MSNLDNLTSKIINDAKEKAAEIEKKAKETAEEKYNSSMKKAQEKKEKILETGKRERELLSERMKSGANLKARDDKLKAKQSAIDKVILKLKERLVNMSEGEYIDYISKNIDASSFNENKKLIVKREYVNKVKERFPNIKVEENEFVNSGFIVEENGIQENYTFEVKLDFMRDELEVEISKLLFS